MKLSNNTNQIIVFDLDGTLSNSEARYKLGEDGKIDLDHWRVNSTPEQIALDLPIPHMVERYKQAIADPSIIVVIATARIFCDASHLWCLKHLGTFPDLISSRRDQHDRRSGNAIKGEFIRAFRSTLSVFHSVLFIDDNKEYLSQFLGTIPDSRVEYIQSNQGY